MVQAFPIAALVQDKGHISNMQAEETCLSTIGPLFKT